MANEDCGIVFNSVASVVIHLANVPVLVAK